MEEPSFCVKRRRPLDNAKKPETGSAPATLTLASPLYWLSYSGVPVSLRRRPTLGVHVPQCSPARYAANVDHSSESSPSAPGIALDLQGSLDGTIPGGSRPVGRHVPVLLGVLGMALSQARPNVS